MQTWSDETRRILRRHLWYRRAMSIAVVLAALGTGMFALRRGDPAGPWILMWINVAVIVTAQESAERRHRRRWQ